MTDKTSKTSSASFQQSAQPARRELTAEEREMFRDAGVEYDDDYTPRDPRLNDPSLSQKQYKELRLER